MLAIRLQRRGRKNEAFYRIIVQEARRSPSSGQLVRQIGTFNPHSKETVLNKNDAKFFLNNGAQPSNRVAQLFKSEGVKLPKWVEISKNEKRDIRNPEKLRKNQPKEAESDTKPSSDAAEEPTKETPAEEKPTEESPTDKSADEAEAADKESKPEEAKEPEAKEEPKAKEESEETTEAEKK